jgi:hypothetical protein
MTASLVERRCHRPRAIEIVAERSPGVSDRRYRRVAEALARRVVVAMPQAIVSLDLSCHPSQTRKRVASARAEDVDNGGVTKLPDWR